MSVMNNSFRSGREPTDGERGAEGEKRIEIERLLLIPHK